MRWIAARLLFVPTLSWNLLLCRVLRVRDWWSEIDGTVILGALPFPFDVETLASLGVTGVINSCEEYKGPVHAYRSHGIEQLRVPTFDYVSPSLADIRESIAFIRKHQARNGKVYVHCKAGRGRSATIALCWLVENRGLPPRAALDLLTSKRRQVASGLHRRPAVRQFAAIHHPGNERRRQNP